MARRIVRTTRRIQTNGVEEPPEVIHEREVRRVIRDTDPEQDYEVERSLQTVDYLPPETVRPGYGEMSELHTWVRSIQDMTQRQLAILRDFDIRLRNLEYRNRAAEDSFARLTWWALWGILMLILGSALVVVLILIIASLPH